MPNAYFDIRKDQKTKDNQHFIYLYYSAHSDKIRISTNIKTTIKAWNRQTQSITKVDSDYIRKNNILTAIRKKADDIIYENLLRHKNLHPKEFYQIFKNENRTDLFSFIDNYLKANKNEFSYDTHKTYNGSSERKKTTIR